jgi:hypothetical protein
MKTAVWMMAAACVLLVAISGCGGGSYDTAPVEGTVTFEGQPVPGGSISFIPIGGDGTRAGKPGSGTIQSDGTYKMSTYGTDDGAMIGRHNVLFSAPEVDEAAPESEEEHSETTEESPYEGLVPKQSEIEVVDGQNTIDIELVPGSDEDE